MQIGGALELVTLDARGAVRAGAWAGATGAHARSDAFGAILAGIFGADAGVDPRDWRPAPSETVAPAHLADLPTAAPAAFAAMAAPESAQASPTTTGLPPERAAAPKEALPLPLRAVDQGGDQSTETTGPRPAVAHAGGPFDLPAQPVLGFAGDGVSPTHGMHPGTLQAPGAVPSRSPDGEEGSTTGSDRPAVPGPAAPDQNTEAGRLDQIRRQPAGVCHRAFEQDEHVVADTGAQKRTGSVDERRRHEAPKLLPEPSEAADARQAPAASGLPAAEALSASPAAGSTPRMDAVGRPLPSVSAQEPVRAERTMAPDVSTPPPMRAEGMARASTPAALQPAEGRCGEPSSHFPRAETGPENPAAPQPSENPGHPPPRLVDLPEGPILTTDAVAVGQGRAPLAHVGSGPGPRLPAAAIAVEPAVIADGGGSPEGPPPSPAEIDPAADDLAADGSSSSGPSPRPLRELTTPPDRQVVAAPLETLRASIGEPAPAGGGSSIDLPAAAVTHILDALPPAAPGGDLPAAGLSAAEHLPNIARRLDIAISEGPAGIVEIALDPEELGSVRLGLVPDGGGITVFLSAERPETGDLLRRHAEHLARDLREAGYGDVSFRFGSDTASGGGHPDGGLASPYRTDANGAATPVGSAPAPAPRPQWKAAGLDLRL